jgi:WD40 repeat protein
MLQRRAARTIHSMPIVRNVNCRVLSPAGLLALLALLLATGRSGRAAEESDRRSRREPGLILETGGRTGACDALAFTADGTRLLAVGDDRVVRSWGFDGNSLSPDRVLRWSVWRQNRGAIYAMALSPGPDQRFVAVGGLGMSNGTVAVLDRTTGEVVHAITKPPSDATVWAMAFSPTGREVIFGGSDGAIWLWRLSGKPNDLSKLGQHAPASGANGNCARCLTFTPDGKLVSAAEHGPVLRWNWDHPGAQPEELFTPLPRHKVAASGDGRWLAIAGQARNSLEVWSIDRRTAMTVPLGPNDFAQSVALDQTGRRLAVGVRTIPRDGPFVRETATPVVLIDLSGATPVRTAGPPLNYYAEAFAFHPDARHLAVAGGSDYEVTAWDIAAAEPRQVGEIRSPGGSIWGVGLSADGGRLGFRTQRNAIPDHPNNRAIGPWTVFDLRERRWAPAAEFDPVRPILTLAGWTVTFSSTRADEWYAVSPTGNRFLLPLDRDPDDFPRCFTFLPSPQNLPNRPPRLAVGHYWGWSLYELTVTGPRRLRVYSGHMGYVTALAPSKDGTMLLSASRDQTIACWSLAEWEGHPFLGARYAARLGRLFVDAVEPGSPAWEADLTPGDEVLQFMHLLDPAASGRRQFFHQAGFAPRTYGLPIHQETTSADEALGWLARAEPQREFLFLVQQSGRTEPRLVVTHGWQRPLWCFFPTRSGEWVLWRYLDYSYDASAEGDAYIGWQVSGPPDKTPAFYPAREFDGRGSFHRPDKIDEVLADARVRPDRVSIPAIEPPDVTIHTAVREVTSAGITLDLVATPRGPRDFHRPKSVTLWVNDYRYKVWPAPPAELGPQFGETINIPADRLPFGLSRLTIQCESRAGTTVKRQIAVNRPGPEPSRRLYALLVGVANYRGVKMKSGTPPESLPGVLIDMDEIGELVRNQEMGAKNPNGPFEKVVAVTLENDRASPENILASLDRIAGQVRPDDLVLLYLAGHGYLPSKGVAGSFVFVGPTFDERQPSQTGLTMDVLYDRLTGIPCPKAVFIMACHSGDATQRTLRDPVRELTPGGVGPFVLTACAPSESALVDPNDGSLMAQALLKAAKTGRERSVLGLAEAVGPGVRTLLADLQAADRRERDPKKRRFDPRDLSATQTPQMFAPDPQAMQRVLILRR